jgi:hypothetical protein
MIKITKCPVTGCEGVEIEQTLSTTLLGFPTGILDQNHITIYGFYKLCGTHFKCSTRFEKVEIASEIEIDGA